MAVLVKGEYSKIFSSATLGIIILFVLHSSGFAQTPVSWNFPELVKLAQSGKIDAAFATLKNISDKDLAQTQLSLKYLALGNWALDLKKWSEAREYLETNLKLSSINASHAEYLIGHSYKEEGNFKLAQKHFEKALNSAPPQNIIFQSRFELSEMAAKNNNIRLAKQSLQYLERRWRGTPNYPEVLWRLIGVELRDKRNHVACRWARKLYSQYPSHAIIQHWGLDLTQNKYDKERLGCVASDKDIKERMRRLNLSGFAQQAREEINNLIKGSKGKDYENYRMLLARHLELQGFPREALQILSTFYDSHRMNYTYLNFFARVSARASEYSTAIGAYFNAYQMSPRSRNGREALFTAAFLSYQTQDYDGAYRKFTELTKKFASSGLARDAKWHLAWLKYLKEDYAGAEFSFRNLLNEKYYARRRRVVRPFANDRTKYWLGMSLLNQEKFDEAKEVLLPLSQDKEYSYYSFAAKGRLALIPSTKNVAMAARQAATENGREEKEVAIPTDSEALPNLLYSNGEEPSAPSEEDSEESLIMSGEDESVEGDETSSDGAKFEAADANTEDEEETGFDFKKFSFSTLFQNRKLQNRFLSAQNLITIGMSDWARWELFEIERKTRDKEQLKKLMEYYSKIESYNRVTHISEVSFSKERIRDGVSGARLYWSYNFPQAYEKYVTRYSQQFGVPKEFVYAIMRAESHFNREALSPVGASGLMQIMPYTANHLSRLLGEASFRPEQLFDPGVNLRLGTKYLSRLQKEFDNQIPLVAAAYNAGPHRVHNWLRSFGHLEMDEFIEHVPFIETRNYMKKVVRNFALYQKIYNPNPEALKWLVSSVKFSPQESHSDRENWDIID